MCVCIVCDYVCVCALVCECLHACVFVLCVCVCAYWHWKMAALVHSCSDGVGQSSPARCEHVAAGYTHTSVSGAPGESRRDG